MGNILIFDEWPYSPEFQKLANFLGLPASVDSRGIDWSHDDRTVNKIKELHEWGKNKTHSENIIDIMAAIKILTRDLGVTFKGKTLVDHLWGWMQLDTKHAEIDTERLKVEKEMSLYEKYKEKPKEEIKEIIVKLDQSSVEKTMEKVAKNLEKKIDQALESKIELQKEEENVPEPYGEYPTRY